jgi:ABC-2 type transport system ATP-binding protein
LPILAVKYLTKRFGDFTAVDAISFELEAGQILGFLGPNGAGKTTTIQMLLGRAAGVDGLSRTFTGDPATSPDELDPSILFEHRDGAGGAGVVGAEAERVGSQPE